MKLATPEWQEALQERLARSVEALRLVAEWDAHLAGGGELLRALQDAGAGVHLGRGLQQQVGERRVEILAGDQVRGRGQQRRVLAGNVPREVEGPAQQHDRR
jgi:hypothetical protein